MTHSGTWHDRVAVAARVIAAVFAGYGISYLFAGALPLWLPIARTEAVLWSSLLSFVLYTSVVLYAFGARSVTRLYSHLGLLTAMLLVAIWWRR